MAFLILKDDALNENGMINDFIYFDEEQIDEFKRVISNYAHKVREIRFERSVKVDQLQKLGILLDESSATSFK